ncbi:MAG TPA: ethylbenzene dehydrogenase-related protein [Rhodocyclaceae bacterium]|nr:hypothetical protein [Rhodocyclaceae bacterium]HMV54148.1 ethylbenzene dehydrogenase-related protein [Rhodocyclaceae bacterium]HMZ84008.1 ethylbenzene dehydrogenase-related protein [Rhodocyclaceae bacterium]HNA05034.1 ethylbenzene dehydrogenase-related protein [Rhodocyclaceae bacterium]HNB77073.1 ethylbenzene dehydrogenase-related protein [Rhodocyclaceae bacterium]
MNNKLIPFSAVALFAALGAGAAHAAAPADWGKVPSKKIILFYPGVSPIEWITKGTEHSGFKGMKKGERCLGCHEEELAEFGKKMVSGQKIEPNPPKGKPGGFPVNVQAAHDGTNMYLRFSWKNTGATGGSGDAENPIKLAFMLEDNKVEWAAAGGCWATCHQDARTMPGAADDKKTKYVAGGSLASGKFYDLVQWKSGKGAKPVDGYVAEKRVMEGGKALVDAKGELKGDTWTVTFTRKLTGGEGDVAVAAGKQYNFGFAIHDDSATGRFHHVSFGYTLGLDDAKAEVNVVKQ